MGIGWVRSTIYGISNIDWGDDPYGRDHGKFGGWTSLCFLCFVSLFYMLIAWNLLNHVNACFWVYAGRETWKYLECCLYLPWWCLAATPFSLALGEDSILGNQNMGYVRRNNGRDNMRQLNWLVALIPLLRSHGMIIPNDQYFSMGLKLDHTTRKNHHTTPT